MKQSLKMFSLLAATALTFGLAGCSSDSDKENQVAGEKATLNISVVNPSSRVVGTALTSDNSVNDFTWFATDGTTILFEGYSTGSFVAGAEVTTAATQIYLVANAGNLTGTYTAVSALTSAVVDIREQFDSRAATAVATATYSNNGSGMAASVNTALTFISARIQVTVKNNMSNNSSATSPDLVELSDIVVLNAGAGSKYFGNSLAAPFGGYDYYSGIVPSPVPTGWTWPASVIQNDAFTNTCTVAIGATDAQYYYYVGENAAVNHTEFPTIVAVKGTFKGADIYFPVHLSAEEYFTSGTFTSSVLRGYSYNIIIDLKGEADNGGGGTTDPTKPLINADLDITIEIEDWIPVNLNKEFN